MLLAEDPLVLLLERLRDLPVPDRQAILQRLSANERQRVDAALGAAPTLAALRFADDIAARIADTSANGRMTAAARESLMRIVGAATTVPNAAPPQGPSLFARVGDAFRWR